MEAWEEKWDETVPWVGGVDPGRVNCGVAFLNCVTREAVMMSIDFMIRPNPERGMRLEKGVYEEKHVFSRAQALVDDYDDFFRHARIVGVEKQMRREHLLFAMALTGYIRGKHPHVLVITVIPGCVNAFFGTKDKKYEVRKGLAATVAIPPFIGAAATLECARRFYKGDFADKLARARAKSGAGTPKIVAGHVDPQDAFKICVYLYREWYRAAEMDARPIKFPKKPKPVSAKFPLIPVRTVRVARVDMRAGLEDIARRKAEGGSSQKSKKRKAEDGDRASPPKKQKQSPPLRLSAERILAAADRAIAPKA